MTEHELNFSSKKVLVVGLGKSGVSSAHFLHRLGADVTVTDAAPAEELAAVTPPLLELGIRAELGGHRAETFLDSELIILSPGVPHTLPEIAAAAAKGTPVWGELELASRFIREPIVAVTGTNGKTTTTRLVGDMLAASGYRPFVGGNIGTPLVDYAAGTEKADVVVAEVSSFQLDTIVTFKPRVGVLLNISADHLDRYTDLMAYARAKARLFENQATDDVAVLNGMDPVVQSVTQHIAARKMLFRTDGGASGDALINCESVTLADAGGRHLALDLKRVKLAGQHNRENIAAAALAALAAGGSIEGIQRAVDAFEGLAHRLEYVTSINEVAYYDDSKATNVDAVVRALDDFVSGTIVIMGGRDKGGDYGPLRAPLREKGKLVIVIGEAAPIIKAALAEAVCVRSAASMEDAVNMAHAEATSGDTVLLSPACSSFDMFDSYAHRGQVYRQAVWQLSASNRHE